jgi:hypothetical protein
MDLMRSLVAGNEVRPREDMPRFLHPNELGKNS